MIRILFICVTLVFLIVDVSRACDVIKEAHNGCKIENSQCLCSFGCKSEFRYQTKKECTDALKGISNDICSRAPCINGGSCIQISLSPGYKCRCEGTKHYGPRCQRSCPRPDGGHIQNYPHECIEI